MESVTIENILTKEELQVLVRKTVKRDNFTIANISLKVAGDKKTGFICDYMKLAVKVVIGESVEDCNFFLKCLPFDNAHKLGFIKEHDLFSKEGMIYDIMDRMCTALGDTLWCPRLFLTNATAIVFEDLNIRGFACQDPKSDFTKDHCLLALDCLAKQQAGSIIYEERRSQELGCVYRLEKEYEKYIDPAIFQMTDYYESSMEAMLVVVEKFSKFAGNQAKLDIIKSKWRQSWTDNLEYASPSKVYRNVLAQRDLWGRNLMYRCENKIPKECLIIDYQVLEFMPPVADLASLLYLNLSKEQRLETETEMIEYFYGKLSQHVSRNNLNIDDLLPKAVFLESWEKYRRWGLTHGCLELEFMLLPEDSMQLLLNDSEFMERVMGTLEGRLDLVFKTFREDSSYKKRILDTLEDFIDGYILA